MPSIQGDSFQAPQHPRKPMMVTYNYVVVGFWLMDAKYWRNTGGVFGYYQRANAKDDVGAQVVIRSLV